jgi:hypothetical protein
MGLNARYRLNAPQVIAEVIDDEAIIVNLDTGTYYSLRGAGADIWRMAAQGLAAGAIPPALSRRYTGDPSVIEDAVGRLLEQLSAEGLLAPRTGLDGEQVEAAAWPSDQPAVPFEAPSLQKYTDMTDLLLLDPIHDVNGQAWPNAAADQ